MKIVDEILREAFNACPARDRAAISALIQRATGENLDEQRRFLSATLRKIRRRLKREARKGR